MNKKSGWVIDGIGNLIFIGILFYIALAIMLKVLGVW